MPEILFVSGKGGTGKTSLTAAFAHLATNAVICDLDVDAPDLHLLLQPKCQETHRFYAGFRASIRPEPCKGCKTCLGMCRFDAIRPGEQTPVPVIDPLKCEGCKVCVQFCPCDAIAFTAKYCGAWYVSETRFGPMVHAQLNPGEENSGRLVALLRQKANEMVKSQGNALMLSDGPPGIGCPVISAASRVDLAVIVTEPTPAGVHDMKRIMALCDHFHVPVAVIINKCDLNATIAREIETDCRRRDCHVVAKLPHAPLFVQAMVQGAAVTEYSDGELFRQLEHGWDAILELCMARSNIMLENQRHSSGALQERLG